MNERRSPETPRACCGGTGFGWARLIWILLGVLGLASLAAVPSLLEAALSKAGLF